MIDLQQDIESTVRFALKEDIGSGDITAQLISESCQAHATVITREACVVCGQAWVDEVFRQLDPRVEIEWHVSDGEQVTTGASLYELKGAARSLLTGERTALNFLQLLSGTATTTRHYVELIAGTHTQILDTRKTIPGLRTAQKYAVSCGGAKNHRTGLYDAFLIKENHILACGGIAEAVTFARKSAPGKSIEVEVESMDELTAALRAKVDIIMLDNFSVEDTRQAVATAHGSAKLEASGGITSKNIREIAETGVDYISLGELTKNCRAIDLSMRLHL